MRIGEKIKQVGYFWLPDVPEKKYPGTLNVEDGGQIHLEIIGNFEDDPFPDELSPRAAKRIDRIIGLTDKVGLVTLDRCFYTSRDMSTYGIVRSVVKVNRAIEKVAFDACEEIRFNSVRFSVEGIDEWVGIHGFEISREPGEQRVNVSYAPPPEIAILLDSGMKLVITYSWSSPYVPDAREVRLSQKTHFKLVSKDSRPVDDFKYLIHRLANFLCFASDKTVSIDHVVAFSDAITEELGDEKVPVEMRLIYASLPFSTEVPELRRKRMLFSYSMIRDRFEEIINGWISAYDVIDPALNLYFSVRTGSHKYLEGKFLALAQAIETYHRRTSSEKNRPDNEYEEMVSAIRKACPSEYTQWLDGRMMHGNEISLRLRLIRVFEPFSELLGTMTQVKSFVTEIVDTRNYLTHYDKTTKGRVVSGADLYPVCRKMEAVLQLHFMRTIGFDQAQLDQVLQGSYELQQKLGNDQNRSRTKKSMDANT